jgi:DNA-binding MarR family transcriptional regulator
MTHTRLALPATLDMAPNQQTGFLLQWAHQRAKNIFNAKLGPLRIETRHLGVLMLLAASPGLNQKEVVEQLELDKSSVVLILDDLERLGLAKRLPNPRDRRAHTLQITARGRARLTAAKRTAARLGRDIFAGLTSKQRRDLDRALARIITNCARLEERRAS